MKRQATDWENTFTNHISAKDLYSEYIKNTLNSTVRTQIRKQENDLIKVRYDCVGKKKKNSSTILGSFATVSIKLAYDKLTGEKQI